MIGFEESAIAGRKRVPARFFAVLAVFAIFALRAARAGAQPPAPARASAAPPPAPAPAPATGAPQFDDVRSDRQELTNNQQTQHHIGHVELVQGDLSIFADDAWYYTDEHKFVATGNVVFAQGNNRISAERVEFDTETRTGTFHTAYGIAPVKPPVQRGGSIAPPPLADQETYVYFFGETIKKVGPKKYEISKGGFTTCVQPTPRWDLSADTITLNIDHYTLMRSAILSVKGVPMFYLPILYYPTKREGRATGFLLPTYGQSSLRGQEISNAFFWAIDRSQDATVMHDWFSKTGQGVGAEYRFNFSPTADGYLRSYLLDQHETTYAQADGTTRVIPGSRSYEIRGAANQALPGRIRARGAVEYFSSIVTSQTFNTNIYDALAKPAVFRRQPCRGVEHLLAERHVRPSRVLLRHDQLGAVGKLAEGDVFAERASAARAEPVFRRGIRIRAFPARPAHGNGPCRLEPEPLRLLAADTVPVQEVAVVHRELHRRLAGHVLHTQPGSRDEQDRRRRSEPALLHAADPDRRPGVQSDLGYTRQRICREVQALDRADLQRAADIRDRQLQADRACSTASTSRPAAFDTPTP